MTLGADNVLVLPTVVKGRMRYYIMHVRSLENFDNQSWRDNYMRAGHPPLWQTADYRRSRWRARWAAKAMDKKMCTQHGVCVLKYTAVVSLRNK